MTIAPRSKACRFMFAMSLVCSVLLLAADQPWSALAAWTGGWFALDLMRSAGKRERS